MRHVFSVRQINELVACRQPHIFRMKMSNREMFMIHAHSPKKFVPKASHSLRTQYINRHTVQPVFSFYQGRIEQCHCCRSDLRKWLKKGTHTKNCC